MVPYSKPYRQLVKVGDTIQWQRKPSACLIDADEFFRVPRCYTPLALEEGLAFESTRLLVGDRQASNYGTLSHESDPNAAHLLRYPTFKTYEMNSEFVQQFLQEFPHHKNHVDHLRRTHLLRIDWHIDPPKLAEPIDKPQSRTVTPAIRRGVYEGLTYTQKVVGAVFVGAILVLGTISMVMLVKNHDWKHSDIHVPNVPKSYGTHTNDGHNYHPTLLARICVAYIMLIGAGALACCVGAVGSVIYTSIRRYTTAHR